MQRGLCSSSRQTGVRLTQLCRQFCGGPSLPHHPTDIAGGVQILYRARGVSSSTATMAAAAAASPATSASDAAACGVCEVQRLQVVRVPALSDNYVWLLHEPSSNQTAVVDPAEVAPVNKALQERGWSLNWILNTHHHADHTGGNKELKRQHAGLQIVGPRADAARIPGIDIQLGDGDAWRLGELEVRVFDTPGHTRGHICFWLPEAKAAFVGDTLFALGCGRTFEGDAQTMWSSLSKLAALPRDTAVFCAHEYTASNARFAVSVDPGNALLAARKAAIDKARAKGQPTVPSQLGLELDSNPFLRPADPGVRAGIGAGPDAADWQVFGRLRAAKDTF